MKPESKSKTVRAANTYKWVGIATVVGAVLAFLLDGMDALPLNEDAIAVAKYVIGAGAVAIAAGIQFYKLRLVTSEAVMEGQ